MTKRRELPGQQLTLDLVDKAASDLTTPLQPNVVAFVDAATLAVRREAIRRVQASGIFAPPSGSGPRLKA